MDHLTLFFLLVVSAFASKCGAQSPFTTYQGVKGEELNKMVFYDDILYVGGNTYLYKFNAKITSLYPEKKVAICTKNCGTNVNKILLINSNASELIECSSGDNGLCKVRNLDNLTMEWNSSNIVNLMEVGLTVSTDKKMPAQGHLTAKKDQFVIAITNGSGVVRNNNLNILISLWTRKNTQIPDDHILTFKADVKDYSIIYVASFQYENYSYFFTNQMLFPNQIQMVSKVVRVNTAWSRPIFFSYTDFIIECSDGTNENYNILNNAILMQINETPTVAATFTTSSGGSSILCTIALKDINTQAINSWINYMNSTCNDKSYKSYMEEINNCKANLSSISLSVPDNVAEQTFWSDIFHYAVDWSSLSMKYVAGSTSQEGVMVTIHDSVLTNQNVLFVGTTSGLVFQFVYTNGTYARYNTLKVAESTIRGIYQYKESDHSLFIMTKNELHKYISTTCAEYHGNHCGESGVMKGRNPLCGWCIYEQRASLRSKCSCNTTDCWLQSLTTCISLGVEPKGATTGTERVDIQLTPSLSLLDDPMYQYFCRWQNENETIKNATKNGQSFKCSIEKKNVPDNNQLRLKLEFGVKMNNKTILLAEAPFLIYSCSNFKKCGECTSTEGANCTWCPFLGQCKPQNADCSSAITNSSTCPQLANQTDQFYVHSGVNGSLNINIINNILPNSSLQLLVGDLGYTGNCISSQLSCPVFGSVSDPKAKKPISVQYMSSNGWVYLDDNYNNYVTIYNCAKLAGGCNYCKALNPARYKCAWDNTRQLCSFNNTPGSARCPAPIITEVSPKDGPYGGEVTVTLKGTEFGVKNETIEPNTVVVSGKTCGSIKDTDFAVVDKSDFTQPVRLGFQCQATPGVHGNSTIFYISEQGSVLQTKPLILKNSTITRVYPDYGPVAGGTKITLFGKNLGIGNRDLQYIVLFGSPNISVLLQDPVINETSNDEFAIIGLIPTDTKLRQMGGNASFKGSLNGATLPAENIIFSLKEDPVIKEMSPKHGYLSGGTMLTVTGTNLRNVELPSVYLKGYDSTESCLPDSNSNDSLYCKVPIAPADIKPLLDSQRKRRSPTCPGCMEVEIVIKLDGIEKTFTLKYYHDPSLSKFSNGMELFKADDQYLTVHGDKLTLLSNSDVNITIGIEQCRVVDIKPDFMKCAAPREQPKPVSPGAQYPEVNIAIGNQKEMLGQLQYLRDVNHIATIAGAVGGAVLFFLVLAIVCICLKYRKTRSKARELEGDLNKLEMEIKSVARQEFLDMHTTMSTVNRKLIEQGFPYHNYQQYSCNVLFASDYLLSEPVMTDNMRSKFKEGMKKLEALLENKLFLTSMIGTMEKQKSFFLREKSNLAGNLCAIMMGRMDYLHEVLEVILTNLVQETSGKRGMKTLFRRCESITEKILSNWLLLCMYPHLKNNTGSPLYLLYIATRKTIESGPIDALTNDSKFTLSEDKLLKKYEGSCDTPDNRDVKFEAKTLTLNVVVGKSDEIFPCKALDCDTITQVKVKCLDQIYVNYPASQMGVNPKDLILEWHAGFGGRMVLKDQDNTSTHEGLWVRVNTLAHYSVSDQSNMALVDPSDEDLANMEDYVNLAQINTSLDNQSMESDSPLTSAHEGNDVENPAMTKHWHLVKKDEENTRKEKPAIAELYLNRLLTTKQSLRQYIEDLVKEIVDSNKCPLPAQFLFQFLDNLGETMKADTDTLHSWKSHSYAIRVLACLIHSPGMLFDISIPSYVSENLDIISQVFRESFELAEQKVTKETPSQKLIFLNEVRGYREQVQEFYTNIRNTELNTMDLIKYFSDVNKLQQETTFNKTAALYRFFMQIKPYNAEIMDDLSLNKKTSSLQLDRKLGEIMEMMEEE